MLQKPDIDIITKYVDEKYYDRAKLINYLEMHTMVGNEIFAYCDKNAGHGKYGPEAHSPMLDKKYGYTPLPVEAFIRRIPFYFYVEDGSFDLMGNLGHLLTGGMSFIFEEKHNKGLEDVYSSLEYMFYEKDIQLVDIFNYPIKQRNKENILDVFFKWNHYLQLGDQLDPVPPALPECFIVGYNDVLEKSGLLPIMYELDMMLPGEYFWRDDSKITIEGVFPCDRNGQPILKWIGVKIKNAKSITCSQEEFGQISSRMKIELAPDTIIYGLNCYNNDDEDDQWYQLYAGPQTMQFDHTVLKSRRNALRYTQQEVADAVGATVRTYQKWETGETTPDGHYLLRLMNWLDILSVQDIIRYAE